MLQVLHDKGLAAYIITPISKEYLELCRFTFFDNSDIITDAGYAHDPELPIKLI